MGDVLAFYIHHHPSKERRDDRPFSGVSHSDLEFGQVNLYPFSPAQQIVTDISGSFFGRVLGGLSADRFGRYNMIILMTGFSGIIVLALWLPGRGNATAIVFSALYGFSSGAFSSLAPASIAQISDIREVGVRNGTFFAIISLGVLTGTPIGGSLVPDAMHGSYLKLQLFCGVVMFAGSGCYLMARVRLGGLNLCRV